MNFITKITAAGVIAGALSAPVFASCIHDNYQRSTATVIVSDGKGSGVYLGDGRVLTAAHVTVGNTKVSVVIDGASYAGTVILQDTATDVAMVQVAGNVKAPVANISCRTPSVGEQLEAIGNPLDYGVIHTWGRVAGKAMPYGPWASGVFSDMVVGAGMSGGPVFDGHGQVVGIVVAGTGAKVGSLSFFVPGETICAVLARPTIVAEGKN